VEVSRAGLLVPGTLVEIDVIAVPADGVTQPEVIRSARLPEPLANYSPAVRHGDWIFLAGQLPTDFGPDELPAEFRVDPAFPFYGSAIEKQTDYTLRNLQMLLEDAGSDLDHVVKAQVFLKDLRDFHGFDEVWKSYFPTLAPPRTTVQVNELLIGHSLVEIDLIAVTRDGAITPRRISTDSAPRRDDGHVQATEAGGLVFLAGQLATDFTAGIAPAATVDPAFPYFGSAIEKQTEYLLANCGAVLAAADSAIDRVVKTQVFLTDLRDFAGMDKIWRRTFPVAPARTTVELPSPALLVPGALVEVDIIAASR
jgi:reactive intermediate/imine deaminase